MTFESKILSKREIIMNWRATQVNHEKARKCELRNQTLTVNHAQGPWENFKFFSHTTTDQPEAGLDPASYHQGHRRPLCSFKLKKSIFGRKKFRKGVKSQ